MGIHLNFSGKQEACTLNLFDAIQFCIRPVSNNLNREAGEAKLKMPAWTGRKQWKWAHEMYCLFYGGGKDALGGGQQSRSWPSKVMHCQNCFVSDFFKKYWFEYL